MMSLEVGDTKQSTWYLGWPSSSSPGTVTTVTVTPVLKSVSWVTPVPLGVTYWIVTVSALVFPDRDCLNTEESASPLDTLITSSVTDRFNRNSSNHRMKWYMFVQVISCRSESSNIS